MEQNKQAEELIGSEWIDKIYRITHNCFDLARASKSVNQGEVVVQSTVNDITALLLEARINQMDIIFKDGHSINNKVELDTHDMQVEYNRLHKELAALTDKEGKE